MTRKHFRAIAASIAAIENLSERKTQAENMADVCAKANSRFNRSIFFTACGL